MPPPRRRKKRIATPRKASRKKEPSRPKKREMKQTRPPKPEVTAEKVETYEEAPGEVIEIGETRAPIAQTRGMFALEVTRTGRAPERKKGVLSPKEIKATVEKVCMFNKKQLEAFLSLLNVDSPEAKAAGFKEKTEVIHGKTVTRSPEICCALHSFLPQMANTCIKGWHIVKVLGKGGFGRVYSIWSGEQRKSGALKIVFEGPKYFMLNTVKQEAAIQKKVSTYEWRLNRARELGLDESLAKKTADLHAFAKLEASCSYDMAEGRFNFLTMERIHGMIGTFLTVPRSPETVRSVVNLVFSILDLMKTLQMTHGDFHWGNFGYQKRKGMGEAVLVIDFGKTTLNGYFPGIDFIQLYRSFLMRKYGKSTLIEIRRHIKKESFENLESDLEGQYFDEGNWKIVMQMMKDRAKKMFGPSYHLREDFLFINGQYYKMDEEYGSFHRERRNR